METTIARNVETNRRLVEAFNRGGLEEALEYFAEDVEVYDPDLPGELRGRDAMVGTIGEVVRAFKSITVKRLDMYPVGDRIVSLIHTVSRGEGRRGEVEIDFHDAHVATFRDGLVSYWRIYGDYREAFSDVGLDPDHPGEPYPEVERS
ncbi:MAG TPA: nuclear transport factor 2 family protein [Solirubrobacterales bacterium]|jgi:ketosteroid isomerase-like protein|nr:nuclear transport factor 2 family protein [Solirubrobacterales bacterium]